MARCLKLTKHLPANSVSTSIKQDLSILLGRNFFHGLVKKVFQLKRNAHSTKNEVFH